MRLSLELVGHRAKGRAASHAGVYNCRRRWPRADRTVLTLEPRDERGSRASRRLRRDGLRARRGLRHRRATPSPFKVDARRLRAVLAEGHALFDVELDGGERQPVIVKDQQRDPVAGHVVHLDLLKVRLDEKIQSTVPLELEGVEDAPGVKEGGVLEHVTRELNIEALPTDIPDRIVADVSGLGIAETMTLSSVTPAGRRRAARRPRGDRRRDRHRARAAPRSPRPRSRRRPSWSARARRLRRARRPPRRAREEGSSEGGDEG